MPLRDRQLFKTVQALLVACTVFFVACPEKANDDSAAFRNDRAATARINEITNSMRSTGTVSADEFAAIKAIREKFPNAPEVRSIYKNSLILRGDWESLESFLTEAASIDADDRILLGKARIKRGNFESAAETLRPLAGADPNNLELRSLYGVALYYLGRDDESAAQFDPLMDRIIAEKRVEDITIRGLLYIRRNDLERAEKTLLKAAEIAPQNVSAINALATVYARLGNDSKASEYRSRTDDLNRTFSETQRAEYQKVERVYEIESAWKRNDYAAVIKTADELLKTTADRNGKLVLLQYLYEANKALGNEQEAQKAEQEAQKLRQQK